MKKNLKYLVVLSSIFFLLPFASCSKSKSKVTSIDPKNCEPNPASDFEYELTYDLDGVVITGFKGSNKRVIIVPETIENLPIKSLGYNNSVSIELGDYSTELLDFSRISVKRVFLKGNLGNSTSPVKIILPEGVEEIGGFWKSKIESINIPSSVKVIDHAAFLGTWFTNSDFEIPEGVEDIGMNAFSRSNIKSITIPASTKYIWAGAFLCCDNLETINFPENKDDIAYVYNTHYNCILLTSSSVRNRIGDIIDSRDIDDKTRRASESIIYKKDPGLDIIFSGKALESDLKHLKELRTTKIKKYEDGSYYEYKDISYLAFKACGAF